MPDPAVDIQQLSPEFPIALLPVRIETRFVPGPPAELLVRVYPDEIAAELGNLLTTDAAEAAREFWRQAWQPANEPDAWRRMLHRYPAHVAAGLIEDQEPDNLETERGVGEPSWAVPPDPPSPETAVTRVLPDCWIVVGYRGSSEVLRYTGGAIVEPLALSFRRDVAEGAPELIEHDGLFVEPALLWTVDFDAAVAAGMGMRVPISGTDLADGFDRLVVYGVKTTLTAADTADRMSQLLARHRRTRGLALVRQGTPTNNSAEGASGYPPPDDADRSFAIERGAPLATAGSDGAALAAALGIDVTAFHHLEGSDRIEQQRARAMNQALWPCTLGYFLEQMISPPPSISPPLITAPMIADIRAHFIDYVRGRGPLPAFRIGRVPYGVLPVAALAGAVGAFETALVARLTQWQPHLLELLDGVARVGKTPADPDADLLGILAVDASAREARLREVIGPAYVRAALQLLGAPPDLPGSQRAELIADALGKAALGGTPRVATMTFDNNARRINRPMVTGDPLSEEHPLADNYIATIRTATTIDELDPPVPSPTELARPLLYHLLKHGALVEYGRTSVDLAISDGAAAEADRREVELFHIAPGTLKRLSPRQRFAAPLPRTAGTALGTWLLTLPPDPTLDNGRESVRAHLAVLAALENVPTAELERLLTETLDVCSHRLDAWNTSLATRRLAERRAVAPIGVYLGAYAFVENLRQRTGAVPGVEGGFIHAPSASHASTAAILRNAYLTRGRAEEVAIDLSSRRVRRALALLDGVRQGQPAGAVLGYWFERSLHDRQLDRYIAPFRRLYPIDRMPDAPPEAPSEQIAARNVVHGLALRDALFGAPTIPWGDSTKLPAITADDQGSVATCLAELEDDVDAVTDLLTAESIHSVVQGNTDRAQANLASVAGTGNLPSPRIVEAPVSGTAFTHRVAIVLGTAPATSTWSIAGPRHIAEPRLDGWLATMLGDPGAICCRALHGSVVTTVTMQDLGLGALDFMVLALRTGPDGGELASRVVTYVRASAPGITDPITVDLGRPTSLPQWPPTVFSVDEALEIARLAGELVAGARPLVGNDLRMPHDGGGTHTFDTAEMDARATASLTRFADVRGDLDAAIISASSPAPPPTSLDDLRAALWAAAAFGVRTAVPVDLAGGDDQSRVALVTQGRAAQTELARRHDAANVANAGADKLAALFGSELPILVPFTPSNRGEIETALASPPGDPIAVRHWLLRMARVRDPLDRLRLAHLASDAITAGAPSASGMFFDIAQLPFEAGAPWIGAPFSPGAPMSPRAGTVSIAVHRPAGFGLSGSWAGLLVDEWAETVPAATQLTSYAVHHQAPGAEAPQCVLLAVAPPSPDIKQWAQWIVEDCIKQAFDVARMRAIDSDLLGPFASLLPCIYLAANVADDAIRSPLGEMRIQETQVLGPE